MSGFEKFLMFFVGINAVINKVLKYALLSLLFIPLIVPAYVLWRLLFK